MSGKVFEHQTLWGRFETWTTKPDRNLLHTHQVHGIDIISPELCRKETLADGMIFKIDSIPKDALLTVKTADCMPILIQGEHDVVFLHAGWKGLALGILQRTEIKSINPLYALIGPSIHNCCFEVSEDFHHHFPGSPYFEQSGGKYFFNLQAEAFSQLESQFPDLRIEIAPGCTCCDNIFHSYRRNKTTERNWNLFIKG